MKYKNQLIKLVDCNNKECNVIQVSITKAKNAYNNGMTIWLHPCNTLIDNMWLIPYSFNKTLLDIKYNGAPIFDNLVNQYQYYKCNNQLGNYPIFFIEK